MRTATADPGFQVRGGRNKKNCAERREALKILGYFVWKIMILHKKIIFFPIAEGGAKICGVFRVQNHNFSPKKSYFFQSAPGSPNLNTPVIIFKTNDKKILSYRIFIYNLGGIFILRTFKNTLYAGVLFVYTRSSR